MTALSPQSRPTKRNARAWAELPVRPWLVMTLCLLIAAIGLAAARFGAYLHERRVIESGTPVEATVLSIGLSKAREGSRDEIQSVVLRYTPPGSIEPLDSPGDLPRKPGNMLSIQDVLNIRVDPQQPMYWTERQTPQPVSQVLITPLLCLIVAGLSGLIAWLRRAGVLRVVQNRNHVSAHVVSVRPSPLAPFSRQIGLVLSGSDRRVLHCYWPNRLGAVAVGQDIEVIAQPPRAVVASLYS